MNFQHYYAKKKQISLGYLINIKSNLDAQYIYKYFAWQTTGVYNISIDILSTYFCTTRLIQRTKNRTLKFLILVWKNLVELSTIFLSLDFSPLTLQPQKKRTTAPAWFKVKNIPWHFSWCFCIHLVCIEPCYCKLWKTQFILMVLSGGNV